MLPASSLTSLSTRCSAGRIRLASRSGSPDLELLGVLRGMLESADRRGVTRTSEPTTNLASRAFAWLYDALKDATLVPRATISPTMIIAEAAAQDRRRMLRVSRPRSGRPNRCRRGSGRCAKMRSTTLPSTRTPPIQIPIGTITRWSCRDTARPKYTEPRTPSKPP